MPDDDCHCQEAPLKLGTSFSSAHFLFFTSKNLFGCSLVGFSFGAGSYFVDINRFAELAKMNRRGS